jgi:flagellar biosynthetic protein FlhB
LEVEQRKYYLRYDLQLFAKEGPGGEKTEQATPKKLADARKEGQVAKSTDIVTAFMLLGLFVGLKVFVGMIGNRFLEYFTKYYQSISSISSERFTIQTEESLLKQGIIDVILLMLPIALVAYVVAFGLNVYQVKWAPTLKPLKPKFNKLNPIKGMKKLFSKDKLVELLKSMTKVCVLGYVVYDELKDQYGLLFMFYRFEIPTALVIIGNIVFTVGIKISLMFLAIALADLFYQKRKFKEDMKMTKQEVKDEFKSTEGDPHIKGKIRSKMREASQRRMMQSVPEADVVITNPTHLAVALKYDRDSSSAPIVVAKGADYVAQKIKEIAREHKVEIVENKPVARMLYYNVDVDQEIPPELYQTVAEILAYVYGLKQQQV